MDRPWEDMRSSTNSTALNGQRTSLPSLSDMAQGVPATGRAGDSPTSRGINSTRDSGNWSMQSPSKHSSVMSSSTNGIQLPSLGSSHTSPNGHLSAASSDRSPFSATFPNGISLGSNELPTSNLSHINRTYDPHTQSRLSDPHTRSRLSDPQAQSRLSDPHTQSRLSDPHTQTRLSDPHTQSRLSGGGEFPPQEARRSSVDSRMNNLALQSPLPSTNASQTSLVSDLQRERGIPIETPRSNGFTMGGPRDSGEMVTTSLGRRVGGKTAPPINANPRTQWPNPNAENPTKGFPYAFPDPELAACGPSSTTEDEVPSGAVSTSRSRRDSMGGSSVTSSIFTNDSRMPQGQRRLEEGQPFANEDYSHGSFFNDRNSAEFTGVNHHHHQLQNKQLDLMDDPDSPNGQTPYSRTPELRVSHKLAERKRRSEMKGLFEELRSKLPADGRVSKTSKWEILTKAIEYIKALEHAHTQQKQAAEMYRRDMDRTYLLERENQQLRDELQRLRPQSKQSNHGDSTLRYHHGAPQAPTSSSTPRPGLPVLNAPPVASAGAMQGVQYST